MHIALILAYDVSHLTQDADRFVDELKSAIMPYSWDDTNGDGSVDIRQFKGRKLMTVPQPLKGHLQIQEYMRELARLPGVQKSRAPSSFTGSRIVSPSQTQTGRGSTRTLYRGNRRYVVSGHVFERLTGQS